MDICCGASSTLHVNFIGPLLISVDSSQHKNMMINQSNMPWGCLTQPAEQTGHGSCHTC